MRALILATLVCAVGCGLDQKGDAERAGQGGGNSGSGGAPDGGNWPDSGIGGSAIGGSAGSQVGGASGTGGISTGNEDCGNKKDDDGDGQIDCADSDCTGAGWHCAPTAGGWQGPAAVYQGQNPAPNCDPASAFPTQIAVGGTVHWSPAVCGACTCAATGVTCPNPTVHVYGSSDCTGPEAEPAAAFSGCHGFTSGGKRSLKMDTPNPTGNCAVTNPAPVTDTPSYDPAAVVCGGAPDGAGCGAQQICVPGLPTAFTGLCVYKDGPQASCPPGYGTLSVTDIGIKGDNRSCSTCTCKGACDDSVVGRDNSDCTGATYGPVTQNQCLGFTNNVALGVSVTISTSCSVSGQPAPTGGVTTNQLTICCQ